MFHIQNQYYAFFSVRLNPAPSARIPFIAKNFKAMLPEINIIPVSYTLLGSSGTNVIRNIPVIRLSLLRSSILLKIYLPIYAKRPLKKDIGSVDPDQMPQNAASDQGLHCLHLGQKFSIKHGNVKTNYKMNVSRGKVEESTRTA